MAARRTSPSHPCPGRWGGRRSCISPRAARAGRRPSGCCRPCPARKPSRGWRRKPSRSARRPAVRLLPRRASPPTG
eukprot:14415986-Alexandrium_andersonii.AAC.1